MSIESVNIKSKQIVDTVGSTTSGSRTDSVSQPINMKSGAPTPEENQKRELEFINSTEFKNCSDKDKLELLKQQFPYLAGLSDEKLKEHLTQLKVASEKNSTTQDSQTDISAKSQPSATANSSETSATSELEQLAERYCQENNIKNADIDVVISKLSAKKRVGNLTKTEQRILDLYNQKGINSVELVDTDDYFKTDEHGHSIPSEQFLLLSPERKIQIAIQKHLEKTVKDYDKLSDEEKQKLLSKNCSDMNELLQKHYGDISSRERLSANALCVVLAAGKDSTIEDMAALSREQLDEKIINSNIKQFEVFGQELKNATGNENLKPSDITNIAVDFTSRIQMKRLIINYDAEYQKLATDEDKQAYIEKKYDEYLQKELMQIPENTPDRLEKASSKLLSSVTEALCNPKHMEFLDDTYIDPVLKYDSAIRFLEESLKGPISQNERKKVEADLNEKKLFKHIYVAGYCKNFEYIDVNSQNEILEKVIKSKDSTPEIRETAKKFLESNKRKASISSEDNQSFIMLKDEAISLMQYCGINAETTSDEIVNIANNFDDKKEYYSKLLVAADFEDSKVLEKNIIEAMKKEGFSDKEIDELVNSDHRLSMMVSNAETSAIEIKAMVPRLKGRGPLCKRIAMESQGWFEETKDKATLATAFADTHSVEVAKGFNKYNTKEQTTEVFEILSKDKNMSCASLANLTENVIETAKDDKSRVDLASVLSKLGNSTILEGLAAGSDSIKNNNYKTQYNTVITDSAKNYSPEIQKNVQTVLTTGEISTQTKSNSEPAISSYHASADTYSSNERTSAVVQGNSTQHAVAQGNGSQSNIVQGQSPTLSNLGTHVQNNIPTDRIVGAGINADRIDVTSSGIEASSTKTSVNSEQIKANAAKNQAQANQKMKDIALDNVAQVKQKIDDSIAEWELKKELKLSDEAVEELKQAAVSEALDEYILENLTQKEVIISQLMNAETISEVYDILYSNLGSKVHQKFIDALASYGSSGAVRSFIKSKAGNTDVIKELLIKTTNNTVRNELLGMLPSSDVIELLEKNLITNIDGVDHKILYQYLSSNIYSMTQTNFANYLKYLPFDEREKLVEMRNKAYGIQTRQNETEHQVKEEQPQVVNESRAESSPVATNPQSGTNSQKVNNKLQTENPQTKFAAGETRKTLADGRVITNQGTTFAGVSNNQANEEGYRVIDPKQAKQDGSPIGMNDEVLTPGSAEWLRKYNKQAPTVAFTMGALEEQEERTGGNFGSNRVPIGRPIKKKYNPNSFNTMS